VGTALVEYDCGQRFLHHCIAAGVGMDAVDKVFGMAEERGVVIDDEITILRGHLGDRVVSGSDGTVEVSSIGVSRGQLA
jgi:hypothetical protein